MIAERIETNQVDIQTKRLYKRYATRKQQDYERKKEVRTHIEKMDKLIRIIAIFIYFSHFMVVHSSGIESYSQNLEQVAQRAPMIVYKMR